MKSSTFQCRKPFFRVISSLTLSLPLVLSMGLFSGQAQAVCPISGFEDEDGNLAFDGTCPPETSALDWNSFAPTVDWTPPPAAPYRVGNATASGWIFVGQEDHQVSTADTGFAGGVKQDASCAPLRDAKAPNKDDLKRIYLSTKTVDGHTILNLAWVRIPQNTTSASAHVGFEFNQGETPCIEGDADGLVAREAGDMLVVYDFEGGSAAPVITLRRWLTDTSDAAQADFFTDPASPCDVDSNSTPCWGDSKDLTALGFAEARVNVGFSVPDGINPSSPNSENLADSEFGEAGIDLTAAGVFMPGQCASFGTAFGVSRSSGNSGQAQMKDLVGPVPFTLANCGTVIVRKQTVPADATTEFDFSTTVTTTPATTTSPFMLKDDGVKTIVNVNPGTGLTVTEDVASLDGYELTGIDCSAGTVTPTSAVIATGVVTFDMTAGETLDCTYTNTARGDITVTKQVVNACTGADNDGGLFTLFIDGFFSGLVGNGGSFTKDDLAPGNYAVGENDPGAAYASSIGGDADCSDGTVSLGAGGSVSCTVTNTRQPHIRINKVVTDGSSAEFDLKIDGVIYKSGVSGWVAGDGDNAGNGDSVEARVSIGNHTISEVNNDGTAVNTNQWLVNISCTDGSKVQGQTSLANVSADSGELIECTIYNIPVAGAAVCL